MTRIAHPGALFIAIGLLAFGLGPATDWSLDAERAAAVRGHLRRGEQRRLGVGRAGSRPYRADACG